MGEDQAQKQQKKRVFRQFYYRGIPLDDLLDMDQKKFAKISTCRIRRKIMRDMDDKYKYLLVKLRKAKKAAQPGEKPPIVKTHLRSMIVLPEMIGNIVGVYTGKEFVQVEPEMIGHYLGEFALSIHPVQHGRPGLGATHSSRFIPLK